LKESPEAFGSSHEIEAAQPLSVWRERTAEFTAGGERVMFVVEGAAGRLGGCAGAYFETDGTPVVVSMWVEPESRGGGAGRGLLAAVVDWARQRDARRLKLMVVQGNRPAAALYLAFGFRPTGVTERNPRGRIEDEMVLDLDH
jgi:GNAT superfamily N-acetyltransferase